MPKHSVQTDTPEKLNTKSCGPYSCDYSPGGTYRDKTAEVTKAIKRRNQSIEKREKPEEAMNEDAEKYRAHFSLTNDVMFSYNDQFKLLSITPNVERILGYKPEELVGRSFRDLNLLHTDSIHEAINNALHVLSGETVYSSIYQFITKDGTTLFGEVSGVPIKHGGRVVEVVSVARDITNRVRTEEELKKHRDNLEDLVKERTTELTEANELLIQEIMERDHAEESLRKSEAKYRFLTEKMNDIVWTADMDFHVTYDSPSVEKILGFTQEERLGQHASIMITPESFTRALNVLDTELMRDHEEGVDPERTVKLELEYYHKNGSTVWMENVASAIRDDTGKIIGFHGVARNIAERKRAEEELNRYSAHLEELVRDRTADLTKAYEQLKQENEVRKSTEATLRSREIELEEKQRNLEEMNTALKVLLGQREEDKDNMETNIITNIKSSVLPYIERLRGSGLREGQMAYLSEIELQLGDIASSFIKKLSSEYIGLSPSEIQVASMIKEGKSSKEIARILNVSVNTVLSHRYYIRIKTGLKGKKKNLRSYLQTMG